MINGDFQKVCSAFLTQNTICRSTFKLKSGKNSEKKKIKLKTPICWGDIFLLRKLVQYILSRRGRDKGRKPGKTRENIFRVTLFLTKNLSNF